MIKRYIITVELPEALHSALQDLADRLNVKKSDIVRWALKDYTEFLSNAWPVMHTEEQRDNQTREVILNVQEKQRS